MLTISKSARISPHAEIGDSTRGSKIRIDSFVKIVVRGGLGDVVIGKNSYVNSGNVIYSGNGVNIGENVLIAANCTIVPVNHEFRARDKKISEQRFMPSKGGIIIEDCVIGALSLVKGKLDEYGVYAGNPLLKIGERS